MSPLFRIILILVVGFIGSAVLVLSNRNRIDFRYLAVLMTAFPFVDLHVSVGQLVITPYMLISLVYIALRFRLFSWFVRRVPVLMLIGVMVIATVFSQFKLVSVFTLFQRLLLLTPVAATYSLFLKRNISKIIFRLILPPILYTLIFAIIQILIDPSFSFYYSVWDKEERLSFCYRDPQVAGCTIATFIILLFNLLLKSKKITYLVLVFLLFIAGCFTGSKSFLIGVTLGITLSLIRSNFSIRKFFIVSIFISVLLLTYNFWSELSVFQRMTEVQESVDTRSIIFWHGALEIYHDHPIFGIGPGSFSSYVEHYDLPLTHKIGEEYVYASQPESGYLLWLDEYGIFSLVLIGLLVYVISRKGVTSLNFCALIPWAVCFVSLYNIQYIHISILLTVIVGAIFAVHKRISSCSSQKKYK